MISNAIIPVQIKRVKDPFSNETIKATVPMNVVFEKDFDAKWLSNELKKIEDDYFNLVKYIRGTVLLLNSAESDKSSALLYWKIGDAIIRFNESYRSNPLVLCGYTKSLSRDAGVSEKTITRCKRFRLLYPDIANINTNKTFHGYVALFERSYKKVKGNVK
ncbi:MAG: hypothetical protein AB1742_13070 [bacterium]